MGYPYKRLKRPPQTAKNCGPNHSANRSRYFDLGLGLDFEANVRRGGALRFFTGAFS